MEQQELDELMRIHGYGVFPVSMLILAVSLLAMLFPVFDFFAPLLGGIGVIAFFIDYKRLKVQEKRYFILSIVIYIAAVVVLIAAFLSTSLIPFPSGYGNQNPSFTIAKLVMTIGFCGTILFQLAYAILPFSLAGAFEKKMLILALAVYTALIGLVIYWVNNNTIYFQLLPGSTVDSYGFNYVNFQLARLALAPGIIMMAAVYLIMSLMVYHKSRSGETRVI